jgi:hypothetical protein
VVVSRRKTAFYLKAKNKEIVGKYALFFHILKYSKLRISKFSISGGFDFNAD